MGAKVRQEAVESSLGVAWRWTHDGYYGRTPAADTLPPHAHGRRAGSEVMGPIGAAADHEGDADGERRAQPVFNSSASCAGERSLARRVPMRPPVRLTCASGFASAAGAAMSPS